MQFFEKVNKHVDKVDLLDIIHQISKRLLTEYFTRLLSNLSSDKRRVFFEYLRGLRSAIKPQQLTYSNPSKGLVWHLRSTGG